MSCANSVSLCCLVKYRIRCGRKSQIYHTSDILCTEAELAQFTPSGEKTSSKKNPNMELHDKLVKEYELMTTAFGQKPYKVDNELNIL